MSKETQKVQETVQSTEQDKVVNKQPTLEDYKQGYENALIYIKKLETAIIKFSITA